jgi:hypothetical protein
MGPGHFFLSHKQGQRMATTVVIPTLPESGTSFVTASSRCKEFASPADAVAWSDAMIEDPIALTIAVAIRFATLAPASRGMTLTIDLANPSNPVTVA